MVDLRPQQGRRISPLSTHADHNGGLRAEAFQDLLLLRYCLCSVARALARELAIAQPASFSTHIRRTLFFAFSSWTEEGSVPGDCPTSLHSLQCVSAMLPKSTPVYHVSQWNLQESGVLNGPVLTLLLSTSFSKRHASSPTLSCQSVPFPFLIV